MWASENPVRLLEVQMCINESMHKLQFFFVVAQHEVSWVVVCMLSHISLQLCLDQPCSLLRGVVCQ